MMRHHDMLSGKGRRLASCLVFGGLLLIAPEIFAQPTLNQGGSSSSGSSASSRSGGSVSSGSSSSGSSASSSRSSGGSRSSASSGRSSAPRPRATAPTRSGNNSAPNRRSDVRRHRNSSDKPADISNTTSGGRSYHGDHRGSDYRPRNRGRRGHGYGHGYGYGYGYGRYHYRGYRPYGYGYFGIPYFYGPYGYHHYRYPSIRYGSYYNDEMGALDLDVRPEKAQIFIDGTMVGVADQYDGFPAYLWLEKGTYDVVIYKEGYETISRQYTIYPGVVLDVNDRMARGTAVKPEDLFAKSSARREERLRRNEERRRAAAAERSGAELEMRQQSGSEGDVARLLLNITPSDAAAYLNGHFLGTAGELGQLSVGLIVEPGDHTLEVVRPGYETQRVPVQIPAGDKITIDLELVPR